MQTFDPRKRLTVDEALEHPYVSAYVCLVALISEMIAHRCLSSQHDPEDEPGVASLDPDYFDFDREHDQRDVKPPALCSHPSYRA